MKKLLMLLMTLLLIAVSPFLLIVYGLERKVVGRKNEWLKVVVDFTWLPQTHVREEMKKLKKTRHSLTLLMLIDLEMLKAKGLVESHYRADLEETLYRLTQVGYNEKIALGFPIEKDGRMC